MRHRLTAWFELDERSLAAFRMFLGICLSWDLFQKLIYAKDFYSDWGVMPRTYWVSEYMSSWKISLMMANGESWFQYAFVFIALMAALCFTFGYRTKISQIIAILLLGSIQSRNFLILSCADDLLRLALFWSLLLPLDRHYALRKTQSTSPTGTVRSVGSLLLIVQLLTMYLVTAIYKINPTWTGESSAVYYALNIDHFATPLGVWMRQYQTFTVLLTKSTLIWEIVGPLLILSPFFIKRLRIITALGFMSFHFGLALCLNLGTFPWVAVAYWTIFLPGECWDWIFIRLKNLFPEKVKKFQFPAAPARKDQKFLIPLVNTVFAVLMALALIQNVADLTKVTTPSSLRHVLYTLNLNQVWDMFAPYPIRNDGWFIIEGQFQNGETKDLLTRAPVTTERPDSITTLYPNSEWRKFYLNLWDQGKARILLPFSRYMCRLHVADDGSPLSTLKVTFMKETTPPLGQTFPPVVPVDLWSHDCFAK